MEEILKLLEEFEKRNNISAFINLHSDGSSSIQEFWKDDILFSGGSIDELRTFLINTQYKLDENGRCISPVELA